MAKSAKPTFIPEWARNDTTDPVLGTSNVVEPSEAKKDSGWDPYEKPPRNWMNWLQRGAHLWIDYFNQFFTATHQFKIDEILEETSAAGVTIDGVVLKDGGVTASGTVVTNTIAELGTASGVTIDGCLVKDGTTARAHSILEVGTGAGTVRKKIIEIGDWNMDSTSEVVLTHGLTQSKIRNVSVLIRRDDDAVFAGDAYNFGANISFEVSSTSITLSRLGGGAYDGANFDAISFNRGWVTVEYID